MLLMCDNNIVEQIFYLKWSVSSQGRWKRAEPLDVLLQIIRHHHHCSEWSPHVASLSSEIQFGRFFSDL